MQGSSLTFRTKMLVSVVAVGSTVAVAGLGTFSAFSDTTNVTSAAATGQISLAVGATDELTAGISGMLAGDSHEMAIDLVNGSDGIGSYTLGATGSTALTGPGGLSAAVRSCSVPWSGTVTHTCSGTEQSVLASTPLDSLSAPAALAGLDTTNGATNHLLVTVSLGDVDNTFQGLSDTISWSFSALQRAGQAI